MITLDKVISKEISKMTSTKHKEIFALAGELEMIEIDAILERLTSQLASKNVNTTSMKELKEINHEIDLCTKVRQLKAGKV